MDFLGRRIIPTTLDPLPELFRAAPGCIALNRKELDALARNDGETFKRLAAIAHEHDRRDARGIGVWRRWKIPKATGPRLNPSTRLSMVAAIYKGRK